MGLGQQQKATFALLATEQLCLTPGGADQIRPHAGTPGNRLWPSSYVNTPGKPASAPAAPALPPAASVDAA
ncbi:hypothetical protein CAY53_04620 [Desulfobulbus oralis]|uniref:Uncharacterized protein n=1 Tax=Desulfobulbus oralis TaxID=1986146 RepID=A0A2L1GMG6_9BACT|nr:hypothetical protein CAY53_04620 [Desulfobulbus oralis]